ncbi:hypothetical protein [uncultured Caballeronia sp.]|uniref:hypothetical protein n=1 Tax=uncultured Caballeronia sp. TaxID=1827198 RepID=UPI001576C630
MNKSGKPADLSSNFCKTRFRFTYQAHLFLQRGRIDCLTAPSGNYFAKPLRIDPGSWLKPYETGCGAFRTLGTGIAHCCVLGIASSPTQLVDIHAIARQARTSAVVSNS